MKGDCGRVVLITGAGSGIGAACAGHLHACGYAVYGTVRQARAVEAGYRTVPMDVLDDGSVRRAVEAVLAEAGRLDVVVNNAGISISGAVEDLSLDQFRLVLETNLLGALRVCRAALPAMRGQGSGLIVNVSSVAGLVGLPFDGAYSASKFALEGLTQSLRMEVRRFGVHVALLEPGEVATGMTARNLELHRVAATPPYAARFACSMSACTASEAGGIPPSAVAQALERIIESRRPRLRYCVGRTSDRMAAWLSRLLPSGWFEHLLLKRYGLL
jgi:NAD(P)-dependent dehydrogenase (short-subunit alcohol dehydrogenase family)